jgi:hypothetical protein
VSGPARHAHQTVPGGVHDVGVVARAGKRATFPGSVNDSGDQFSGSELGVSDNCRESGTGEGVFVIGHLVRLLDTEEGTLFGAYTFVNVARALSEISGSAVTYTPVSDDDFVAHAVKQGTAESAARRIAGFFADIRSGQLSETSTDLERLLGRAPASLSDGLAELFPLPAGAATER